MASGLVDLRSAECVYALPVPGLWKGEVAMKKDDIPKDKQIILKDGIRSESVNITSEAAQAIEDCTSQTAEITNLTAGTLSESEDAMTDREIDEQTLWCVRRAADEQVPCLRTCPVPCDLPDHVNPTDELIQLWENRARACKAGEAAMTKPPKAAAQRDQLLAACKRALTQLTLASLLMRGLIRQQPKDLWEREYLDEVEPMLSAAILGARDPGADV